MLIEVARKIAVRWLPPAANDVHFAKVSYQGGQLDDGGMGARVQSDKGQTLDSEFVVVYYIFDMRQTLPMR